MFLFVVCCSGSARAQACNLKIDQLAQAPELLGFRLGMTFADARTRVPQIQFGRADDFGVTKTSVNPNHDPQFDQSSFPDVRTISFDFLDGKLTTLWIGYEPTFKWPAVDEFVKGLSKSLGLPSGWSPKRNGQQLRCEGFTVFVSLIGGGPGVRLSDNAADDTIAARREREAAAAESAVTGDTATRLYYSAGCSALQNVPSTNRVAFKNKDEAEQAGYRLAKACE